MASEGQRDAEAPESTVDPQPAARGPLTIGEPAPRVEARLASADPYRPDSIVDAGSAIGLTVRGASVRGLSKRYLGQPRQDDLCLGVHEPSRTLIAAVADGVSGASRSELAAALAVRHASASVLRSGDVNGLDFDWSDVFEQAAWSLVEEHRHHSGVDDAGVEQAAETLATTLLVATISVRDDAEPHVRLAAVGDSPAYLLHDGEFQLLLGQAPDAEDLLGGGVDALPRVRAFAEAECALTPGSVLLLCTDGLSLPLAGGTGEVGVTLARELAEPPDVADFLRLLDFSRSTYDDDRTLIAVWG